MRPAIAPVPARDPDASTDLRRRRCLQALPVLLSGGLFAGCAGADMASGLTDKVLSAQKLNELVARAFPYTRDVSGLARLTLQNPQLRLLPERNRLGTVLDVVLAETLTGSQVGGGLDLDYGLRFDDNEGAVRMTDVQFNRLTVAQLAPQYQQLLSQYAPPLAEQLLDDFVLYRVPASQLSLARNLGLAINALRVENDGLHIALAPKPL